MHKAETIMAAVKTLLTGLTATGANVQRARVYELTDAELPALTINMGADDVAYQNDMAFITRDLSIEIVAYVKATSGIETELNEIRRQVHVALSADHTLGQSFVLDTEPVSDSRPELSGELETAVASQTLNYKVRYRHSVTNPGA